LYSEIADEKALGQINKLVGTEHPMA